MARPKKISCSILIDHLKAEIDQRYKNRDSGDWRKNSALLNNPDFLARSQNDRWFTMNHLLSMKDGRATLQALCDLQKPLNSAREIENFLKSELKSTGAHLYIGASWAYDCEHLGHLIWLFQNTDRKQKSPGAPAYSLGKNIARVMQFGSDFKDLSKLKKLQKLLNDKRQWNPVLHKHGYWNLEYAEQLSKVIKAFETYKNQKKSLGEIRDQKSHISARSNY
ncbi:MAG: hypothetical protein JXA73_00150 [Acidobacteria bacterium]|nr:hypothetical protein [Acidobacteriota bacterium]